MIQARASIQFSLSSEKSRYIYIDCNLEFKHMASRNLMFLVDIKISHPLCLERWVTSRDVDHTTEKGWALKVLVSGRAKVKQMKSKGISI